MSWHYSQALVAAYSADTSSAGGPSAPLSGSPIPQAFLCSDRMTAFSRLSRFGMTFKPLTADLGADLLTWFLAGSRAKTLAQPARAQALTAPEAGCGFTCRGSLARFDRATSSWRTPQCSLLEGLDEFSETWPRWGMMQNGECSEQSMPAHLTGETGSGLWLGTPTASMSERSEAFRRNSHPTRAEFVKMWPTPTVCGNYNQKGMSATSGDGLATAVKLWPTPCATDHKGAGKTGELRDRLDYAVERGGTKSKSYATPQARDFRSGSTDRWDNPDRSRNLNDQIGGQLNPTWVEWLMGWPLGWTDLKPLEMDRFQQWCGSHGKPLAEEQSK